ncbi:MAG: hypothetical protein ABFC71_04415 [Methanoregula sp.]
MPGHNGAGKTTTLSISRQTYQNPPDSKSINTDYIKIYLEICLNCKRCRS